MSGKQSLTHSQAACFRTCPRKHEICYEFGLRPEQESLPLRVGSAFHAAQEAADLGNDVNEAMGAIVCDPFDLAMVAAMFNGHTLRYAGTSLEVVATEQEFELPLRNPATGAASTVWTFAGKIDRIVRLPDGRLALKEYKTTSRDFASGADYWLKLHMDQQLSLYVLAARALGFGIETILYDVTRRPGLRPLKATPEASRKYTKAGDLYANQRDRDETPEEYAERIAADIAERPDYYFARIEIARLDQDLADCADELWTQQLTIRQMQRTGKWFRNPGSCFDPFRCEYLSICQNRDLAERTPPGFIRSENLHPELTGITTDEG